MFNDLENIQSFIGVDKTQAYVISILIHLTILGIVIFIFKHKKVLTKRNKKLKKILFKTEN